MSVAENQYDPNEDQDLEDQNEDQDQDQDTNPLFAVEDRPKNRREGSATVITTDLLNQIVGALGSMPAGKELRLTGFPRNTKGSAAGFGYQLKKALQEKHGEDLFAAGITSGVKAHVRPATADQKDDIAPWFASISRA